MQPIADYETAHSIPNGWINFAISRSSARSDGSGAWSQLEQGKIPLDRAFFAAFHNDLHNYASWREFCTKRHQGASDSNGPISKADIEKAEARFSQASNIPPLPQIDITSLFWAMMIYSRHPDPAMSEAIERLRASGRFVIAALSNTVAFPDWHPFSHPAPDDVRRKFDIFVSSAHAGVRKPHRDAYEVAVREMDQWSRGQGKNGVKAENVVFLDDIGQNLKGAKAVGMRTIKVTLGRTPDAVKELERLTGLDLGGARGNASKL
jgi:HAD superfamily hydrolase (TIGR01509 family)